MLKEREQRADNHIPPGEPVLFLEVTVRDPPSSRRCCRCAGEEVGGYRVLRAEGAVDAERDRGVAALASATRPGKPPHVYFGWTEGNPLAYLCATSSSARATSRR